MKLIKLNESKTLSEKGLQKLKAIKMIKEDFEDDVFVSRVINSVVGHIYDDKFYDLIKDIIERALSNIDEESTNDVLVDDEKLNTIVWEAMDEGMIYTDDQWTMLHEYCTPQEVDFDTAWSDMIADVERCVKEILTQRG